MPTSHRVGKTAQQDAPNTVKDGDKNDPNGDYAPDYPDGPNTSNAFTLSSTDTEPELAVAVPTSPPTKANDSKVDRDALLHSLLYYRLENEVAQQLGKDRNDAEVRRHARTLYLETYKQLPGQSPTDDKIADRRKRGEPDLVDKALNSEVQRVVRSKVKLGVGNGHGESQLAFSNIVGLALSRPATPLGKDGFGNVPKDQQMSPTLTYGGLHVGLYDNEFTQIGEIGKGGYGRVYKVLKKLDNSFYAVKRISISKAKLARATEKEENILQHLVKEVQALARFDHHNIVRYYNAWWEREIMTWRLSESALTTPFEVGYHEALNGIASDDFDGAERRLLQDTFNKMSLTKATPRLSPIDSPEMEASYGADDTSAGHTESESSQEPDATFENPFTVAGPDFVFENSNASHPAHDSSLFTHSREEVTSAISESHSRGSGEAGKSNGSTKGAMKKTVHFNQPATDTDGSYEENVLQHSSVVPHDPTVATLNIQMSLCESDLGAVLERSWASSPTKSDDLRSSHSREHCFHACFSLEIFEKIFHGVDYLHKQGVVHRDLKPANVFLSIGPAAKFAPPGSVRLGDCHDCAHPPELADVYINPRIGDFGLATMLTEYAATAKPVGTATYRPSHAEPISGKLDVFSLGIILFELLQKFDTGTERNVLIARLRAGEFPSGFAERFECGGAEIQEMIGGMVKRDHKRRLDMEGVWGMLMPLLNSLRQSG